MVDDRLNYKKNYMLFYKKNKSNELKNLKNFYFNF